MKTHEEIQNEAQRMVALGRSYRDEQRQRINASAIVPLPRVLARLPDSVMTSPAASQSPLGSIRRQRRQRYIEAAIEHEELVYRLQEKETVETDSGQVVSETEPAALMVSRSGFDLLHTGYEMAEEDRLSELLGPYADYSEGRGGDVADERTVSEVEEIIGALALPPSDRLRAKAETVDFLEGRLEPSAFIERVIDRQCAREVPRETERETQRQGMHLRSHEF